ncbi:hypothetical protein ACFPYI_01860 [Halomarina salina]|uniref:Uncharacterized protein n=1 Tax=Halomarina salina TaxID=1872699 RepID=A0ABD5RI81_9EURY|nr:hypothetical protein [Halomarina salina]
MTDWGVKDSGTQKSATETYVRVNGTQKSASEVLEKVNGSWQTVWQSVKRITSFEEGDEETDSPSSWSYTTTTANDFEISTASADVLDGARALVHPNGADFEGIYSLPGDGLEWYPGYQTRHRLHFKVGATSSAWNWRYLRDSSGDNTLQIRTECGGDAVRLSEVVGGASPSQIGRIEDGNNASFSFASDQWYALDPWTASGHTAGIELFEHDPQAGTYTSLGSDTGAFDSSLDGNAGVELFCDNGSPRYVFDDFRSAEA